VLPVIWDTRTVLANLHRALRPGGVLLLTVPRDSAFEVIIAVRARRAR
jgi:hypothetical protein